MLKYCALLLLIAIFALCHGSPLEQPVKDPAHRERLASIHSLVAEVNAKQTLWKAAVHPRFSQMSTESLKGMMGYKHDDKLEKMFAEQPEEMKKKSKDDDLPKEFDSRKAYDKCTDVISKIQDQSRCGSCWAVSSASVMSDRTCIKSDGKTKLELSAKEVISCAWGMGCNGGQPFFAMGYWKNKGVVSGGDYDEQSGCQPYPFPPNQHGSDEPMFETPKCEKSCQKGYNVEYASDKHFGKDRKWWLLASEERIRQEIFDNGPVVATFIVYEDFMQYQSGIYQHVSGKQLGGHAVRFIGWGEEQQADGSVVPYWLVANSWNTDWGEEGTFRIVRGQNECGIEKMGIHFALPDFEHK